jgi:hypothetical protein
MLAKETSMRRFARRTAQLGELVAAAFDAAARLSADATEVSRLATLVVNHMLARGRRAVRIPVGRLASHA